MLWLVILTFAVACTALIATGAVIWLLVSITNALAARRPVELTRR
ncbi:hypothetical protein [Nocardia cyriacigeorgica]|nr:hypothetical protein [Nocardia cyriacigeorgica]